MPGNPFPVPKVLRQKGIRFHICHKRRGISPHSLLLFGSLIRLFILVWLGDGFPTVIRSVFRLSAGRFSALMIAGFPPVSWSENCTTGTLRHFHIQAVRHKKSPPACVPAAPQRPVRSMRPLWWCSLYPAFPLSLLWGRQCMSAPRCPASRSSGKGWNGLTAAHTAALRCGYIHFQQETGIRQVGGQLRFCGDIVSYRVSPPCHGVFCTLWAPFG